MYAQKYVGGDISLLTKYEDNGAIYMDKEGNRITDLLSFLKEQGMNTMRVRLFVDPSRASQEAKGQGVCQDIEFVKRLGKKIKDAGLLLMIDFHYSDTWADPGNQSTPYLFMSVNTPAYNYIYDYTKETLTTLVNAGAEPDFIQTGNEITYGMMWDSGCKVEANSTWTGYTDENWTTFTTALKNAGKACREVCPNAKIIIHTERVPNPPQIIDYYKKLDTYGVNYDIIGTSYYPYYHGNLNQLDKAITQFETNFPTKDVMVVETGCSYKYKMSDKDQGYPLTYEGQRQFTEDLITKLNTHNKVNGLFWWFLEANEYGLDWETKRVTDGWYNASLFDNETGRALPALYELRNFNDGASGIQSIQEISAEDDHWYTIDGRRLNSKPSKSGLYIHQQKKAIIR
jgi:arabinogalactan endo-1,4-beta-galactosidase